MYYKILYIIFNYFIISFCIIIIIIIFVFIYIYMQSKDKACALPVITNPPDGLNRISCAQVHELRCRYQQIGNNQEDTINFLQYTNKIILYNQIKIILNQRLSLILPDYFTLLGACVIFLVHIATTFASVVFQHDLVKASEDESMSSIKF